MESDDDGTRARLAPGPGRTLIKGGVVLTLDRALGDIDAGDVLIEGERIVAVGPNLEAAGAQVIEASNMIVMPGFVDSHRHMWEGQIRNLMPDGMLMEYLELVHGRYGAAYRPEDAYVGDLVSAWSAINAGITTVLDWSHIQTTPEHTDAVVGALRESGIRAVFAYGFPQLGGKPWWTDSSHRFPGDIMRLRTQYFASKDQLLTLALAASGGFGRVEHAKTEWDAARSVDARITIHLSGAGVVAGLAKAVELGPDTTYVHCIGYSTDEWKMIADSGGTVSLSPTTELMMDIGVSPFQQALDAGIRPSLSIDAETTAPSDMFTQMQMAISVQHALITQRRQAGEKDLPRMIKAREIVEYATLEGARANGLGDKVGSLTVGKQADLILLRTDTINVAPVNDPVGAVVLGMDTSNVDTVFVAGQIKKRHGKLVGVDPAHLLERASASRDYLNATIGRG